jgi:CheY-like chemotaxis protein
MEAIGRLAGGIAHDFNNLLTAIRANAELLRDAGLEPSQMEELQEIERSAARGAGLTRQLLAFSRKQVLQARVVRVDDVVRGMEPMLRRLIVNDVSLEIRCNAPRGLVKADPGQLEQVVMNLALNARDAMPKGGTLTIETADASLELRAARAQAGLMPGRYVTITVRDTGIGMDEETQSRLFEPFFTTKPKGEGTGLGLPTVFGIVSQAGGHIGVTSAPGAGSTFTVSLPLHSGDDAAVGLPEAIVPVPRGTETILVADDEDAIRIAVRRYLQKQGYTVIAARDGRDAIERAHAHPGRIDLLLTDMVMPEMSGRELIQHLTWEQPGLRVLCMSGFTDDVSLRAGLRGRDAFIQKPFALDELSRQIRRVLEPDGDPGVVSASA